MHIIMHMIIGLRRMRQVLTVRELEPRAETEE